jgi:hypothetical protein
MEVVDVGDISEEAILAAEAMEQGSSGSGKRSKKSGERPQELKDLDAVLEGMPELFVDPSKQQQQSKKKKKNPKALNKEQKDYVRRGGVRPPKGAFGYNPNASDEEKEWNYYYGCIFKFHQSWPELFGKFKEIPRKTPLPDMRLKLEMMRSALNASGSEKITQGLFGALCFVLQHGYNNAIAGSPWLPPALRHKRLNDFAMRCLFKYDFFADEINELKILYPSLFERSVWTRLIGKLMIVGQESLSSDAPAPNAPIPEAMRQFADL